MQRELPFGLSVLNFVRHVREEGEARPDSLDPTESLLDIGMAGMGLRPESIDDEDVEILEEREARVGNRAHIGEIGGRSEAEAAHREIAVPQRYSLEADVRDFGSVVTVEALDDYPSARRIFRFCRKGVFENALEDFSGHVVGVQIQAAGVSKAEGAQVVHTEDVISMAVGVEDGVDMLNLFAESL